MKTGFITGKDGKKLALYLWEAQEPKAILQIVHGMCEHCARYDDFGKYLNEHNVTLAMIDQRGHGKSCDPDSYGYDDGDMWSNNIEDQIILSEKLSEDYDKPLILMGHSYGSFLTQRLIGRDKYPIAYILSGSNYMKGLLYTAGALISNGERKKKGGKAPCEIMANMSFSSYEKKIPGKNNWLSHRKDIVDAYNADPACGYVASNNFYATFMSGIKTLYTKDAVAQIDRDKPIYIFSGAEDPVGEYGKGVKKLYNHFVKCGCNVSMKLYDGGRHEMLNETNNAQVYADVLAFIEGACQID